MSAGKACTSSILHTDYTVLLISDICLMQRLSKLTLSGSNFYRSLHLLVRKLVLNALNKMSDLAVAASLA